MILEDITSWCRLEVRRKFFSQWVIAHWNRLPDHVVAADTVNIFKNRLDKEWGKSPIFSVCLNK